MRVDCVQRVWSACKWCVWSVCRECVFTVRRVCVKYVYSLLSGCKCAQLFVDYVQIVCGLCVVMSLVFLGPQLRLAVIVICVRVFVCMCLHLCVCVCVCLYVFVCVSVSFCKGCVKCVWHVCKVYYKYA